MASRRLTSALLLFSVLLVGGCSGLRQAASNRLCALQPERPYDIVVIDLKEHALRLFWKDPEGRPFLTIGRLRTWLDAQGDSLIAATNAGIYEPGYVPTGFFVDEGVVRQPLNLADGKGNFYLKPNGVFALYGEIARIMESSLVVEDSAQYALQSGPLLVSDDAVHPAFTEGSRNCRLRSGIGVRRDGAVILAISNGAVNFHDFATFFRDELGCPDALYLDGTISSLYAPALGRAEPPRARYATLLAVIPRR